MPSQIACPAAPELEKLVLGTLSHEQVLPLEDHVADCSRCLGTLQTLNLSDTLVELLSQGQAALKRLPGPEKVSGLIAYALALKGHNGERANAESEAQKSDKIPPEPTVDPCEFLAPPSEPDELGRLGPYRVLRVLGSGGMGVVFEAEDPQLKRRVALKAMKSSLMASIPFRQRFLREAQAVAALEHDHIVTIYQTGQDRDVSFLAMQLLQGETLEERLQRLDRLPLEEAVRLGREIAEGLALAHSRGLVHRDIKPSNVFLATSDGLSDASANKVKLLDFGLARSLEDNARLTQSGVIAGTPAYMAPEQAAAEAIDHRCDLFSLGCVLYRMVTGQLPFPGSNALAIFKALAIKEPQPPRNLNPEVPLFLNDLILKLLAKDPQQRPSSAREVASALFAAENHIGTEQPGGWIARSLRGWRFFFATVILSCCLLPGEFVVILRDGFGNEAGGANVPQGGIAEIQDCGNNQKDAQASVVEDVGGTKQTRRINVTTRV
jgi:tRNA A-37 threonylcarbamoyl transferase component Bud32